MLVNDLVTLIAAISESGVKHFAYLAGSENIVISKRGGGGGEIEETGEASGFDMRTTPPPAQPPDVGALYDVTAPNVGTVLLDDAKTGEPLVVVGDTVKKGQLLFVIEAMKLFIDVTAPKSGKIAQICAAQRQTVEFGTVVMRIEPDELLCSTIS